MHPLFRVLVLLVASVLAATSLAADSAASQHPSGGFTVRSDDGFDLWFDAWGEGPGIIFLARSPDENRPYAEALSDAYTVVIFEPRFTTMSQKQSLATMIGEAKSATETHLAGRQVEWDPAKSTGFPMDLLIADLHHVADAAGIDTFVLGGYSGTARMSALLAPSSERAVGVILGGHHIFDAGGDYWTGFLSGASSQVVQDPSSTPLDLAMVRFSRQTLVAERERDVEAFGRMPGPKVVWTGSLDTAPQDPLDQTIWDRHIAQRVRSHFGDYERLGFRFFELEGLTHVEAYLAVDQAVPLIRKALIDAGYE